MSVILDGYTIFNSTHLVGYTAQYAGSFGHQDFTSTFTSPNYATMIQIAEMNSTTEITTGFSLYFKLEGYNPITQKYETWHSRNTPLYSPPSGNTLQNIVLVASWIDR